MGIMERETRHELPTLARPRYFNYFKAPAGILGHSTTRRINTLDVFAYLLRTKPYFFALPPPLLGDGDAPAFFGKVSMFDAFSSKGNLATFSHRTRSVFVTRFL